MLTPLLLSLLPSPLPQAALPQEPVPYEPGLTLLERAAGWKAMGPSAWESWGGTRELPAGWSAAGRAGVSLNPQPDTPNVGLRSRAKFRRVEFAFDAYLGPGSNSGVKLRVAPEDGPLGPEFQLLDDFGNGEARTAKRSLGALYDVYAPSWKQLGRGPQVVSGRILDEGDRLQFWLNGFRTVDAYPGSEGWAAAIAASKFKDNERYAVTPEGGGHIVLQHHGDPVDLARLRYREVPEPVQLVTPSDLSAWTELGDADWSFNDEGHLVGKVGGGGQSFLMTKMPYGDFTLRARFKPVQPGNSGLQIRSHLSESGRLFGYQIEIDSSERAWSGGLYDEARRGWIHNLAGDDRAREAFRPGDWNEYVVECVGPTIRTWVNGVPAADVIDPLDLEGHIALQVHSGKDTEVVWSSIEVWERRQSSWMATNPILEYELSFPEWSWASEFPAQESEPVRHALGAGSLPMDTWTHGTTQEDHRDLGILAVAARPEGSFVLRVDDWDALPTLVIPLCQMDSSGNGTLRSIHLFENWTRDQTLAPDYEALLAGPAVAVSPARLRSLVQTRNKRSKYAVAGAEMDSDEVVLTRLNDRVTIHVNGWLVAALGCSGPNLAMWPLPVDREANDDEAHASIAELNARSRHLTWSAER